METQELKTKRQAFLDNTLAYFNSSTRCVDGTNCQYAPTATSEGCALGRKMEDKELCAELDTMSVNATDKRVIGALPVEIQELGVEFLYSLQKLHDNKFNWTETGLSEKGQDAVQIIKNGYINY